jgi:predicted Rossmann fold flavoprotein
MKQNNSYDVVIIGGGPAGVMAALSLKDHYLHLSTLIVDQSFELGRKLLVAGSGRGNITNKNITSKPFDSYHGSRALIESVFADFNYSQISKQFKEFGIPLYEEIKTRKGKIFPVIDHAKTIRNILVDRLFEKNIQIKLNTKVRDIKMVNNKWTIYTEDNEIYSDKVIVTAGGRTYPALGSDGSMLQILTTLGHHIIEPVPSAVPLVGKNELSHLLQGEKITAKVVSVIDGKTVADMTGDVLFTQYGLSGSAILDVSREISIWINRLHHKDAIIMLSLMPELSKTELISQLESRWEQHSTLPVSHLLWGLFTEKVSSAICALAKIPKTMLAKDVNLNERNNIIETISSYEIKITGTRGWNEAEFTAGGIDCDDIDPKTLASKKVPGIYFAGEIIDIDGIIGGYNLSWAWASGWLAGQLK